MPLNFVAEKFPLEARIILAARNAIPSLNSRSNHKVYSAKYATIYALLLRFSAFTKSE